MGPSVLGNGYRPCLRPHEIIKYYDILVTTFSIWPLLVSVKDDKHKWTASERALHVEFILAHLVEGW